MPLHVKGFGLQAGQDPEVLRVALEAAVRRRELVESLLAVVPVRRMPDVVGQTGHVDQVGIAAQSDRHPPPDLGDLQRMGQSRAGRVPFARPDDLRLVGEPTKRGAVQNPGAVPGEVGAVLTFGARQARALRRLRPPPAGGRNRRRGLAAVIDAQSASQTAISVWDPLRRGLH